MKWDSLKSKAEKNIESQCKFVLECGTPSHGELHKCDLIFQKGFEVDLYADVC